MLLVVCAALIDGEGRVLLAERPAGKPMAGLWEFPGGKVGADEMPAAALARELEEELGIAVDAAELEPLTFVAHDYGAFQVLLLLHLCRRWRGAIVPRESQRLEWTTAAAMRERAMPEADKPLVAALAARLGDG